MTRTSLAGWATWLLLAVLWGCTTTTTTTSSPPTTEGARGPSTAPEQSDPDRRARVRMELASGYYARGQLETTLEEVKLALADGLRRRREQLGLTQTQVAERFGSSQSRVAKMEAADRTVTTDLLLKSLFRLGASPRDVARLLSPKPRHRAA